MESKSSTSSDVLRRQLRQQSVVLDRLSLIAKYYIDHQTGISPNSIGLSLRMLCRGLRAEQVFVSVLAGPRDEFLSYAARKGDANLSTVINEQVWNNSEIRRQLTNLDKLITTTRVNFRLCNRLKVKNLIVVPLSHDNRFSGYIGASGYSTSHAPTADVARYLRLAGEIIHHSVLLGRSEQERRKQEDLFRKVIDINPNFIFAKDQAGRFILVNAAVAEVYGATVADIVGKTDSDFNSDKQEVDQFLRDDLEVMETLSEKFVPEERITDSKGKTRFLQTVKRPIVGDDGVAQAVLGVSTDITDRKLAELEREKLAVKMQQTQRLESLGVLAGGIAHDFNNLLMGIIGNCELAEFRKNDPAWVSEKLHHVLLAANRATELTNQLLAYSGKGHFVIVEADLSELVREICTLLDVVVSKKARLHFELATELPKVQVDVSQVRQVFMNLLTNASDALDGKNGRILVRTECVSVRANCSFGASSGRLRFKEDISDGCYILVQVSDTGVGMDETTIERIFDPFYTTKFTGRGLGLAAVQGIIRGHKGTIRVDSSPGSGSTFSVLFPTSEGVDISANLPRPLAVESLEEQRITVLLVDDEPISREVTEQMLAFLGHDVVVACDGREALKKFTADKSRFSMVLLDLTMPEMDGYETWIELLKIDPGVSVVLMSGYCETDVRERFSESLLVGREKDPGVSSLKTLQRVPNMVFIQKPFGQGQLLDKLTELSVAAGKCITTVQGLTETCSRADFAATDSSPSRSL